MARWVWIVFWAAACGDAGETVDAQGTCSRDAGPDKGWMLIGAGTDTFDPLPKTVTLDVGPTGGTALHLRVRMDGLEPGNPLDRWDPANPQTRVRVERVDTGERVSFEQCPDRWAYEEVGGVHERPYTAVLGPVCHPDLVGIEVRVTGEIIDSTGGRATDEHVVTIGAPEAFGGCPPDGGLEDAGPPPDAALPDA